MHRIAIIDTSIDSKHLHCKKFEYHNICGENSNTTSKEISHGTIVALVFEQFIQDYELINIHTLSEDQYVNGKPAGDVMNLKKALQLCMGLHMDIVILSAASSILSDSKELYTITKKLAQKTVVVAALDNEGYISLPASYPFVVGVRADRRNLLCPGEIRYLEEDPTGANVYVNCMLDCIRRAHYTPSNSLAVPIVAAEICKRMNCQMEVVEILSSFQRWRTKWNWKSEPYIERNKEVPVILVYGETGSQTEKICINVMDELFEKYEVQTSCLCSMNLDYDIRFQKVEKIEEISDDFLFMNCHYKTDLIFILTKREERDIITNKILCDIEAVVEGTSITICYEQHFIKNCITSMTDIIYRILQ